MRPFFFIARNAGVGKGGSWSAIPYGNDGRFDPISTTLPIDNPVLPDSGNPLRDKERQ